MTHNRSIRSEKWKLEIKYIDELHKAVTEHLMNLNPENNKQLVDIFNKTRNIHLKIEEETSFNKTNKFTMHYEINRHLIDYLKLCLLENREYFSLYLKSKTRGKDFVKLYGNWWHFSESSLNSLEDNINLGWEMYLKKRFVCK